jgi:hypothetical protein
MAMGPAPKCHFAPKFSKLRLMQLWRPITLCIDLWLKWGLKQSCSPHQYVSNDMWHNTCMQLNQNDYQLLVVESQTGNLTPDPFFGHNFVFENLGIHQDLQLPKWEFAWECGSSFPHTLPHSWEHEMWLSNFTLGPHLCKPLLWSWAQG